MSTAGDEKSALRILPSTDTYHLSTDASLFSSSLPAISHEKLNFNGSDHSNQLLVDSFPSFSKVGSEDEVNDPLEDSDPTATGSFLPSDEDELLAGLVDGFDLSGLQTQLEDLDDDIFGTGGGLEIEYGSHENVGNEMSRVSASGSVNSTGMRPHGFANGVGTVSGEHPYGEHPSRTLFVRNINSNVEDSELRSLFEQYGDIRTLYTACKHRGFVMISYYDIRAACTAMRLLQNKPLRRRKLDIHFSIPKDNPSEKDINQGTLVLFNLDALVLDDDLRQIFGVYGEIKGIRALPQKSEHKLIEFYDVRAAESALKALTRSDIAGKRIKLEPSRPGASHWSLIPQLGREQEQDEAQTLQQRSPVEQNSLHYYSQAWKLGRLSPVGSNHMPGLASILPFHIPGPAKISPIGQDPARISPANQAVTSANITHGVSYQQHFSVPDSNLISNPSFSDSKSSSGGTLSGPEFLWGNATNQPQHMHSSPWSSSLKRRPVLPRGQGIGFPFSHQHAYGAHHHPHVGSAPSGIQLERNFGFFPESPDLSYISQASGGVTDFGNSAMNRAAHIGTPTAMNLGVAFGGNFTEPGYPSSWVMPMPRNGTAYFRNGSFGGMGDGLLDRGRGRRPDVGSKMDNKMQYQLDLEKIMKGEDIRTTLMIKNIPNKYTSKMLLAAIDETHRDAYDFLYLPIDFKNKCNVGYAFINMVSPSHIITFYEAFNGKKWEKFNSDKVASLAYARIQGKTALISHFQNSSLMNEDKRCRPIVFKSEGQENNDLEHFPSGNLNIFIRQPDGSYAGDTLDSPKGAPDG